MSPVPMWARHRRSLMSLACVPFPLPGGPTRMTRMGSPFGCHALPEPTGPGPCSFWESGRPAARGPSRKAESSLLPSAFCFLPSAFRPRSVLGQPGVVAHDEVAVDFLDHVQGDADDDQEPGAAVEAGD